jgi:hypothetical protein
MSVSSRPIHISIFEMCAQHLNAARVHAPTHADEDDAAAATPRDADQYMPPLEAQAQLQLLWQREGRLLGLLYRATKPHAAAPGGPPPRVLQWDPEGFRLFFIRTIAVPPPRFRPPMAMGDMVAEHAQNIYLTKASDVQR